jgi:hypothetical protein
VIRIAMSVEAYEAIERTLALGAVAAEPRVNEKGERLIWLEERRLDELNSIRRPGESYSEAIIRLSTLWEDIQHIADAEQARRQVRARRELFRRRCFGFKEDK